MVAVEAQMARQLAERKLAEEQAALGAAQSRLMEDRLQAEKTAGDLKIILMSEQEVRGHSLSQFTTRHNSFDTRSHRYCVT